MNYKEDLNIQFSSVLNKYNCKVKNCYNNEINKIFSSLYAMNYISNRVEVRHLFDSEYYNLSFSCVIESFSLILDNYPRGSALVLRSAIENFSKFIIQKSQNNKWTINDRLYNPNKKTIDNIIKCEYDKSVKEISISLNSTMENLYGKLSGISHSLVSESQTNRLNYFSDINAIKPEIIKSAIERIDKSIAAIFTYCLIICKPSLEKWDSYELTLIFELAFGKKKTKSYLSMLKG